MIHCFFCSQVIDNQTLQLQLHQSIRYLHQPISNKPAEVMKDDHQTGLIDYAENCPDVKKSSSG